MNKQQCINSDSLIEWGRLCLSAVGVATQDASFVSEKLVQTSLWGIDSHGIARLPHYLNRISAGSINPTPQITIDNTMPSIANLDGNHGLGIVVMGRATQEVVSIAKKNGIGIVGVRESSHCGAIGIYGRMIADAGYIGIVFTHSDAFVAPHRGYQKFLGTNPICISAPTSGGPPICLDMATSATAFNYIMNARTENQPIPDNVAYNSSGEATADPHQVSSLMPMANHKGYALAFVIDILCGALNGMPTDLSIPPMYEDLKERRHLGSLVLAIDPARFFGGEYFTQSVAALADSAHNQPIKDQAKPVLVPGEDHYKSEEIRRRDGVPIEPGLAEQIILWCKKLSVPLPEGLESPSI